MATGRNIADWLKLFGGPSHPWVGQGVALALGLVGLGWGLGVAPAQAGTVVISTGGVVVSTPNFFLSVGQPVVFYPTYGVYPSGVYSSTVYFPTYFPSYFPTYPVYHLPVYYPVYPAPIYPSLVIDDAGAPQGMPVEGLWPGLAGDFAAGEGRLGAAGEGRSLQFAPMVQFTSYPSSGSAMELMGTSGLAVPPEAADPLPDTAIGGTTYRISSPNPYSESLRTIDE